MDLITILLHIIGFVLTLEIIFIWINAKVYNSFKGLKVVSRYPLVGSFFAYREYGTDLRERVLSATKHALHDETIVAWMSYIPVVFISNIDDLQMLMNKASHSFSFGILQKFIGNGILCKGYKEWKVVRRLMNPAFTPSMLNHYLTSFNKQYRNLAITLREVSDGRVFNIFPYIMHTNIDAVVENIAGVNMETGNAKKNAFTHALFRILNHGVKMVNKPWVLLVPYFFQIYTYFTGDRKHLNELTRIPFEALRKKKLEKEIKRTEETNEKNHDKTLLELLLKAQKIDPHFTDKQIATELFHVFSTGSESTALSGSFLLLLLGIYQDIQKKVYEEVKTVFRDEQILSMDQIHKLKYTEQCILETLRLFTVLPITVRFTLEETLITGDRKIPAYCPIICLLQNVLHDEKFYPNPKQWNPDNFSEENIENRPKNSLPVFGLGPRTCIGHKYGLITLKSIVCYVLRDFHISTNMTFEDIEVEVDVITRSKKGYPIKLTPRNSIRNK